MEEGHFDSAGTYIFKKEVGSVTERNNTKSTMKKPRLTCNNSLHGLLSLPTYNSASEMLLLKSSIRHLFLRQLWRIAFNSQTNCSV